MSNEAHNRAVQAVLQGKTRTLLTMATGTGKTVVAFPNLLEARSSRWNRTGECRRPRILYLADRNVLIDNPKHRLFSNHGNVIQIAGRFRGSEKLVEAVEA